MKYNLGVNPNQLTSAADWYGKYYAWGETEQKDLEAGYNWNNYKFGSVSPFTKYDQDGKTILEAVDDAVTVAYPGFRMPTRAEFVELLSLPKEWITNYEGIPGLNGVVISGNGNTLFIPVAGWVNEDGICIGSSGLVWCSSRDGENADNAYVFEFWEDDADLFRGYRYDGFTLRGVM